MARLIFFFAWIALRSPSTTRGKYCGAGCNFFFVFSVKTVTFTLYKRIVRGLFRAETAFRVVQP